MPSKCSPSRSLPRGTTGPGQMTSPCLPASLEDTGQTAKRLHTISLWTCSATSFQSLLASVHVKIWPTNKTNSGLTIRRLAQMQAKNIVKITPLATLVLPHSVLPSPLGPHRCSFSLLFSPGPGLGFTAPWGCRFTMFPAASAKTLQLCPRRLPKAQLYVPKTCPQLPRGSMEPSRPRKNPASYSGQLTSLPFVVCNQTTPWGPRVLPPAKCHSLLPGALSVVMLSRCPL
jgi:hypothetical protein